MKIDIQFSPGTNDWPALRDAVLRAEAEGYDTTWVFDHFDGQMLHGDRPMLECFTLLGALAEATSTIGLGTLVANVANRHPAVLAAAASSVQRISGGRLTLGLGAGAAPASKWSSEHTARGIQLHDHLADRHAAVVEQDPVDPRAPGGHAHHRRGQQRSFGNPRRPDRRRRQRANDQRARRRVRRRRSSGCGRPRLRGQRVDVRRGRRRASASRSTRS